MTPKGHLVQAKRNFSGSQEIRDFAYDSEGRLVSAGERGFIWAARTIQGIARSIYKVFWLTIHPLRQQALQASTACPTP